MTPGIAALMLLGAALCWGAGNVANKTVLNHLDPYSVVMLRSLLAAVVIAPLAFQEGLRADRDFLRSAAGVALLFAAATLVQQMAYGHTSVTNASFLVNACTILTPILAWGLTGQRPSLRIWGAAGVTLLGAFLMSGGTLSPSEMNRGDLLCLVSALCYAAWFVALGTHAMRYGRPFATSFAQFAVTAAVALPLVLLESPPLLQDVAEAVPELLLLGILSTAVPFALHTYAQRFVAASTAAILTSAESIFGAAGAFLFLGERLGPMGAAGAGLIFGAILVTALAERGAPAEVRPA